MQLHKKFLLPFMALLLGFVAVSCAPPDDDDSSSAPSSEPTISSAAYDASTGDLTLNGSNLPTTNLDLSKLTVSVKGVSPAKSSALNGKAAKKGTHTKAKHIYTISDATVKAYFDKNGKAAAGGATQLYNLALAKDWVSSGKGKKKDTIAIKVSKVPTGPVIIGATYNAGTGKLVISGLNLPATVDKWDFTKLKFMAGSAKSTALSGHATASSNTSTGSDASSKA